MFLQTVYIYICVCWAISLMLMDIGKVSFSNRYVDLFIATCLQCHATQRLRYQC